MKLEFFIMKRLKNIIIFFIENVFFFFNIIVIILVLFNELLFFIINFIFVFIIILLNIVVRSIFCVILGIGFRNVILIDKYINENIVERVNVFLICL